MVDTGFSRYRILSRLGEGGMGEVFLAEDVSLHRKVALKFLLGPVGDGADARLIREARAAAHLDHPFICKVYEVGEQDRRPFFAMEYVDGATVKDRLMRGPLPTRDAVRIAAEVADALQFAHARGIVHRDLKPANVMVGADGHVKVMDFGIAKRLPAAITTDGSTAAAATASLPGELTGTLAYMSPEQIRGDAVDHRSDVFAFGLLLHQMLTGVHPFMRPSMLETANAILNDMPPAIDRTASGGSPLLAHIVARCLEKDRERRYQSLSDVRIELDALNAPEPVATGETKTRGTKRTVWVTAALVAIAATVGVVHWIRPLPFLAPEPALAFKERDWIVVADFNNLTGDAVFDSSLRRALEVAIAQSQYVNVYPNDRVVATLRRMQRDPSLRLDETLASEVALRDNVRAVLACDIAQLGAVYSLTTRVLDPQNQVAVLTDSVTANSKSDVLGALDRLAARVRTSLGESLAKSGAQTRPLPLATTSSLEALKLYADSMKMSGVREDSASLELLRQAVALDPQFALAHAELGRRFYLSAERDTREIAEKHYQTALGLADRLTIRERLWIQASVEDSRGNRERAVSAFKAYLAQYPDDVRALYRLAWAEMAGLQRYRDAIEDFKRVVQLNPSNANAYVNMATAYSAMGDFSSAIPAYQKAFDLSPDLILGVFVNHEYGFTLVRAGRDTEAGAVFERMKKEATGINRARGFRSTAFLEMYRGHYSAAIKEIRQSIAINQTQRSTVSEYRDRLILYSALQAMGQTREASAEWPAIERLIHSQPFGPEWLVKPVKLLARRGQINDAARLVGLMEKTAWNTTAASAANRNTGEDHANIDLAQSEVDLARGRTGPALEAVERAHLALQDVNSLETLAPALIAAGRPSEAVTRYEELLKKPPFGNEGQEAWFQAHLALGRLYEQQGRQEDARRLYTSLLDRWKDADANLLLLKAVRERLGKI